MLVLGGGGGPDLRYGAQQETVLPHIHYACRSHTKALPVLLVVLLLERPLSAAY